MDGVEVFPFAPSKKLYYVDVNQSYVKASCGGTQIFDTWDNQQSGEVYYLDGTGEVIVREAFDFLLTVTDDTVYFYPIDYQQGDEYIKAYFGLTYDYDCDDWVNESLLQFKPMLNVNMMLASEYIKNDNWHGNNYLFLSDLFLWRALEWFAYGIEPKITSARIDGYQTHGVCYPQQFQILK